MIKYFFRQYWRYIAMALAFFTFSFLMNSCEVKAETNYTQSIDVNYSETSQASDRVIYNDPNHTNKAFANVGRGYLVGIILAYKYSNNTSFTLPTVMSINARTDSGYSTCEVSSLSNTSDETYDDMKAALYGFKCDLVMGTNGLISLSVNFRPTGTNTFTTESYRLTFNNNLEAQMVSYEQYVYQYMQDWIYPRLNSINNTTSDIYDRLGWIYNYLQNYMYVSQQATYNQLIDVNTALNELLEQNLVCKNYNYNKDNLPVYKENYYLNSSGQEISDTGSKISEFIPVSKNDYIYYSASTTSQGSYCLYDESKNLIGCSIYISGTHTITPSRNGYIKLSYWNSLNLTYKGKYCQNGNQALAEQNEQIIQSNTDINNSINDSSVDDPDSDLEDMADYEISNSVISDLLLLPIDMFENIIDAIGGTCSSFSLGALYGTTLTLPCIDIPDLIGSSLWGVIDVLFSGIFVLSVRKKFVDIFENITSLKDRGNELE